MRNSHRRTARTLRFGLAVRGISPSHSSHGRYMPLAALAGYLLDLAVWGLALAALLPCLPLRAPRALALMLAAARVVAGTSSAALAAVGALALAGVEATPLEWWPGLPGDPFRLAPDALAAPFL